MLKIFISRILVFRLEAKINHAKNLELFEAGASGEISYLIFIASAICIASRLRQRFETREGVVETTIDIQ